jgi:hypothetical protein
MEIGQRKNMEIKEFQALKAKTPSNGYYLISREWISQWFNFSANNDEPIPPLIDNQELLKMMRKEP